MNKLSLGVLVIVLICLFPEGALACECQPPAERVSHRQLVAKEFKAADAVFSGEVIELDRLTVKFKVERKWKGELDAGVTMLTGAERAGDKGYSFNGCDYDFEAGKKYLVYAFGPPDKLKTHECSRTRLFASVGEDVKELDALTGSGDSHGAAGGEARVGMPTARSNNGMHPTGISSDVIH